MAIKVYPTHQGLAYGDGVMSGAGKAGQVVKLAGNDTFAVNLAKNVRSFGVLREDCADGAMPTVYCNGGTYATEVFAEGISAGDLLVPNNQGYLSKAAGAADEQPVAVAISVATGELKFKLLV